MTTEMLPQCVDYQQAIFETLRRIEQLLSKNEPPVRSMSFSGVLIMEETVNALRVSRSTVKQLIGSGTIRVVRIGRRVLVPRESLNQLLNDPH